MGLVSFNYKTANISEKYLFYQEKSIEIDKKFSKWQISTKFWSREFFRKHWPKIANFDDFYLIK